MVSGISGKAIPSIWQPYTPQQKNRGSFQNMTSPSVTASPSSPADSSMGGSALLSGHIQNLLVQMQANNEDSSNSSP